MEGGKREIIYLLYVNSKYGALRPQKPQGLLGTGRRGKGGVEVGEEGDCILIVSKQ